LGAYRDIVWFIPALKREVYDIIESTRAHIPYCSFPRVCTKKGLMNRAIIAVIKVEDQLEKIFLLSL